MGKRCMESERQMDRGVREAAGYWQGRTCFTNSLPESSRNVEGKKGAKKMRKQCIP